MCLDETDFEGKPLEKQIYENEDSRQNFELAIIPCIPKQRTPYNKHLVDKECIADLKDPKSVEAKFQASLAYLTEG